MDIVETIVRTREAKGKSSPNIDDLEDALWILASYGLISLMQVASIKAKIDAIRLSSQSEELKRRAIIGDYSPDQFTNGEDI